MLDATPLRNLTVVYLDCQATGANPKQGHLMELAVGVGNGSTPRASALTAHLVRLPNGARIPRRVSSITGITAADLAAGQAPEEVWSTLSAAARLAGDDTEAVVVAHYARFERGFIDHLKKDFATGAEPELRYVCTHEIARRLLPNLPRRGLHALAGYFGEIIPPEKRAAPHVEGTAVVWSSLVAELEARGVTTLGQLQHWLKTTKAPKREKVAPTMSRELRLSMPDVPGVYRMLSRNGAVLYVGKATSLKSRFNSHFVGKLPGRSERNLELMTLAESVDYTETRSALEAALLEADEIKRLNPPYNVALRRHLDADLWYAARDLRTARRRPRPGDLGPFMGDAMPESIVRLQQILTGRRPVRADAISLVAPDRWAPKVSVFTKGYRIFRDTHDLGGRRLSRGWLHRLGAQLWVAYQARRAEEAAAADEADDTALDTGDADANDDRPRSIDWSPEGVAESLEMSVMRAAQLIRRAELLVELADSSMIWEPKNSGDPLRELVIQRGEVVACAPVETRDPCVARVPRRSRATKLQVMDPAMYDRLRVYTTELRRLLSEDRLVALRLGNRPLHPDQIRHRLSWV